MTRVSYLLVLGVALLSLSALPGCSTRESLDEAIERAETEQDRRQDERAGRQAIDEMDRQ